MDFATFSLCLAYSISSVVGGSFLDLRFLSVFFRRVSGIGDMDAKSERDSVEDSTVGIDPHLKTRLSK
jgi:hypothetical protein